MRIMHMSRAAETLRWFLIPVMAAQQKLGHYVCICTSYTPDACVAEENIPDAEYLRQAGFDVFPSGLKRSLNPLGVIKAIMNVRRTLIQQKIDVIICHNTLGAAVGRVAAWLAGTPTVVYFAHGFACAPAQSAIEWRVLYSIEKFLGFLTDAVVVMNDYDENLCKTRHIIKNTDNVLRVPGMGVDLSQFSTETSKDVKDNLLRELSIEKNKKIVLCVARVVPKKGVFIFLETAKKICAKRNDICFLLAGGGPSIDDITKIIAANHLEDNFKLLGWRDDVRDLTKIADIFTLPTYYPEGLPVSILEAMACGKPAIVTRHRGCEDIVEDGKNGFLVPVKTVDPLVEKILALVDDDQLRTQMGNAARQRVEEQFELDYCTDKIVEALEKAIS